MRDIGFCNKDQIWDQFGQYCMYDFNEIVCLRQVNIIGIIFFLYKVDGVQVNEFCFFIGVEEQ